MKYNVYFRNDCSTKLEHLIGVEKDAVMKAVSSLLDNKEHFRLKVERVKNVV